MKRIIKWLSNHYLRFICKREYMHQAFVRFNERPIEYGFVFKEILEHYPKTVLDVGAGETALPHLIRSCGCLVTAIDNVKDYWPRGMVNRHYHVLDDDIRNPRLKGPFDMITCISVLEHVPEAAAAAASMLRLLSPEGRLLLTFPFTEKTYVSNVYELNGSAYGQDNPYICQSFSRKELTQWMDRGQARILKQEYWQCWSGEVWTQGQQMIPPKQVSPQDLHQLTCLAVGKA